MIIKVIGSVIEEQGVVFAVVSVKSHIISNEIEVDEMIKEMFFQLFAGIPVVLVAENGQNVTYYGREDLTNFLSSVPFEAILWKKYSFNIY